MPTNHPASFDTASLLPFASIAGAPRRPDAGPRPRLAVDPDALSHHVLRPGHAGPGDIALLGEAYRCWSEVWQKTFEDLDDARSLPSDDFTRQDEISALFHDWECIATASLRWLDVTDPIYVDDSYFAIWPPEVLAAAGAHGPRVCIASSFAVGPRWRRGPGARIRDLLGALVVERFLRSDADALIATVRNEVGMDALTYGLGFRPLAQKLTLHGVEVDLVAYFRDTCSRPPLEPDAEALVQALSPRKAAS